MLLASVVISYKHLSIMDTLSSNNGHARLNNRITIEYQQVYMDAIHLRSE